MKHVSLRLPWHDRGWDGCVCNNPSKNSYCKGFHSVNAEKIRRDKNDKTEEYLKGQPIDNNWYYLPPCTETINVFGTKSVNHINIPKSFISNTSAKTVSIGPNSSGTWPFEDMWDENGERREADERKEHVDEFFNEIIEGGKAGLIFYYCNYDNPISADEKKYLLAGIARVKKIHPFASWDDIPKDQKEKYGEYIWSRQIENDPEQRLRLPYQEYLAMGKDVQSIAVFAEGDLAKSFKYVAHHVSDDNAISLIDKTLASVKTIIKQSHFSTHEIKHWEKQLLWLYEIRKECWISRGLYPGLSSVLKFIGVERPEEFIRIKLRHLDTNLIKDYFFDRFEGRVKMDSSELDALETSKSRYLAMLNSGNDNEVLKAKLCKDKLPFFDLEENQVQNILGDKRGMYSIYSALSTIYENPYIIAEEYHGADPSDFVNFEKIDHGMLPSEDLETKIRVKLDDARRLRCLMFGMLMDSAKEGNTFLEFIPLAEMINLWHDSNDKAGLFNFDLTAWNQYKDVFAPKVVEDWSDGIHSIYLKRLHDAERKIRTEFINLLKDQGIPASKIDWPAIIKQNQTEPNSEQIEALEKLYTSRLSVLTGTAGTGKTTVIRSLVQGIKKLEPRHDFLMLAPTGKSALILKDRINDTSVKVVTIHGFLMKQGWINRSNFTLKLNGESKHQASTIIIDESSMIELMLLATTIRALDMNNIERMILVGDYNQLPPIGPGKIFFDLVQYLKKDEKRSDKHLAELQHNWRQAQGSRSSVLANHFAKVPEVPDEDIFSELEAGVYDINNKKNHSDLVLAYWKDEEDLQQKIPDILQFAISRLEKGIVNDSLQDRYDNVHGIPFGKPRKIEAINIIAPYRHTPSGVDNLNIEVQLALRGKDTVAKYGRSGYVFKDKVLQVRNYTYKALDHDDGKYYKTDENYIPNGTLGYFLPNKAKKLLIKFPKEYDRYSYYPSKKQAGEMLELGYATSVHKAQGSQFDITVVVLPKEDADFVNREMLYTALTRATKAQIIFIQDDISLLKSKLWLGKSELSKRNSSLFAISRGIPSKDFGKFKPENLILEALPDLFVRSEGERMISQALAKNNIGFYYEKTLVSLDSKSFKLPDFTFKYNRRFYYWEHNGMMKDFGYAKAAEKKRRWYIENGYQDNLIETPIEGMNLTQSIKYVLENILNIG